MKGLQSKMQQIINKKLQLLCNKIELIIIRAYIRFKGLICFGCKQKLFAYKNHSM